MISWLVGLMGGWIKARSKNHCFHIYTASRLKPFCSVVTVQVEMWSYCQELVLKRDCRANTGTKLDTIARLNAQTPTAMIGDGINDAPALAKTIGISLSDASQVANTNSRWYWWIMVWKICHFRWDLQAHVSYHQTKFILGLLLQYRRHSCCCILVSLRPRPLLVHWWWDWVMWFLLLTLYAYS